MEPIRLADAFFRDEVRMHKLSQAMNLLREAGFEHLLRRLGEPKVFQDPNTASDAIQQAEARGWYAAVDTMFDFDGVIRGSAEARGRKWEDADFGADNKLRELGFSEEEIKDMR
jgi:hypothetical protein